MSLNGKSQIISLLSTKNGSLSFVRYSRAKASGPAEKYRIKTLVKNINTGNIMDWIYFT